METKDFKESFDDLAIAHGFERQFGAWFKESTECILGLILVKSNFSRLYYLRIKVNLRHAFGREFEKNKEWVKHDIANILVGPSKEFDDLFDLEKEMSKDDRTKLMERLFSTDIQCLTEKLLYRDGIIELYKTGQIFLLPAIKVELGTN